MYQGKKAANGRNKQIRKRRLRWGKGFVLLCSVVMLLVGIIGGSLAYLFTNTDAVVNTFTPASNDPTIPEDFDGNTKSNVKVAINGDAELQSYVRAKIVFSWVTQDGKTVAPQGASEADCKTLEINNTNWQLYSDGYYYYKGVVAGGSKTENLITTCIPKSNSITINDTTYYFCVDVFAQTIQASPDTAVQESWNMSYNNDSWSAVSTD